MTRNYFSIDPAISSYYADMTKSIVNHAREGVMDFLEIRPEFFTEHYNDSLIYFPNGVRNKINSSAALFKVRSGSYVLEAWKEGEFENALISKFEGERDVWIIQVIGDEIRYFGEKPYHSESALKTALESFVGFAAGECRKK